MPSLRRSARLKRIKANAAAPEVDSFYTREKKRREICPAAYKDLQLVMSDIWSDDSKLQLDSTTKLLNLVSDEDYPLIHEVVQSGAVPRLVEFLKRDGYPQLQFEAIRVLNNIAAEDSEVVIDSGAVPVFVKLLESSDIETCEHVVWSLGNIAGESFSCRDVVLNCGALCPLLALFEKHDNLSFLRIGTWALANVFEGGPKVPYEQLEYAIWTFDSLLLTKDEDVLKEACWALLYITHCKGGIEPAMYEADFCLKLAFLFDHATLIVLFPAFRAITSIMRGACKKLDERVFYVNERVGCINDREDIIAIFKKDKRCRGFFTSEMRWLDSFMTIVLDT